jgi:hypothetical protein
MRQPGCQDGFGIQIALCRGGRADGHGHVGHLAMQCTGVGLGIHGLGLDAKRLRGADDATGNLAAIGYQDSSHFRLLLLGADTRRWIRRRVECRPAAGRGAAWPRSFQTYLANSEAILENRLTGGNLRQRLDDVAFLVFAQSIACIHTLNAHVDDELSERAARRAGMKSGLFGECWPLSKSSRKG